MMLWDRIISERPIRNGLRRAGVHFAKAAYEVVGGMAAFVDELATVVRDDSSHDDEATGPTRIEVE
jgi:hypothetical protein